MNIFVCAKQVPDTTKKAAVNADGTLNRASMPAITNPEDLNAVEAALSLRDQFPDSKVIVVSMGPPQAAEMLHELLAMGCDEAVLVSAREFGGSDTLATSRILAAAITHYGFCKDDIILCGRRAIDGDTAQVGPQLAEYLGIPQAANAVEIKPSENSMIVKCLLENGFMTVRTNRPCLITCSRELNEPRYMSVYGILNYDKKPFVVYDYSTLAEEPLIIPEKIGLKGSTTTILSSFAPAAGKSGRMLEGSGRDKVKELFGIIDKKHII